MCLDIFADYPENMRGHIYRYKNSKQEWSMYTCIYTRVHVQFREYVYMHVVHTGVRGSSSKTSEWYTNSSISPYTMILYPKGVREYIHIHARAHTGVRGSSSKTSEWYTKPSVSPFTITLYPKGVGPTIRAPTLSPLPTDILRVADSIVFPNQQNSVSFFIWPPLYVCPRRTVLPSFFFDLGLFGWNIRGIFVVENWRRVLKDFIFSCERKHHRRNPLNDYPRVRLFSPKNIQFFWRIYGSFKRFYGYFHAFEAFFVS